MSSKASKPHSLEILESRIAPAALLPTDNSKFVKANFGDAIEVKAGQVLNTTGLAESGSYLLYVEKGTAWVFFTDLNNNNTVDFNELTGIAAGDGLRMTSFVDIHGDIVTNLKETSAVYAGPNGPEVKVVRSLSDSDNNPANDDAQLGGDGRVLLNSRIEKIEIRSLRATDIEDQNGDGIVDDKDLGKFKATTTYSIFGNIYAGAGFGAEDGGLIIDTTGATNFGFQVYPTIGSIRTGSAVSNEFFSFGVSSGDDISGTMVPFTAPKGQAGGDIINVRMISTTGLNLDGLYAGDGGIGARGGSIVNVELRGDTVGGYDIVAGNGGRGSSGGAGGSILNFSDFGSSTSEVVIRTGSGGTGSTGAGGNGGDFEFVTFNVRGNVGIDLGDGGDGFTNGGNGASLVKGSFTQPNEPVFDAGNSYGTTHLPSTLEPYKGRIGTHEAIDFDKDGFGDYVYTTRTTSQVVIMFGDGNGGFRTKIGADGTVQPDRIYLSGVSNPEALTVADLNGDGQLDVAVASVDQGSHAGVVVFLSQFEHDGPGELTAAEDRDGDGVNDFVGFRNGRFSVLPQLPGFVNSPHQISSLVAGDFDGDSKPELALVVTQYSRAFVDSVTGVTVSLDRPNQVLLFLRADEEMDSANQPHLTGQFYADFSNPGQLPYTVIANPQSPGGGVAETVVIEASALTSDPNKDTFKRDVVFAGIKGARVVNVFSYDPSVNATPISVGSFALGTVDIDRVDDRANEIHRSFENFTLLDFTVVDYDNDGVVDLGAIAQTPAGFFVTVKGALDTNTGNTLEITGTQTSGDGTDNAGTFFGDPEKNRTGQDIGGFDITTGLLAIKSGDFDGDGNINDFAILHDKNDVSFLKAREGSQFIMADTGAKYLAEFSFDLDASGPVSFDVHYSVVGDYTRPGVGLSDLNGDDFIEFARLTSVVNNIPSYGYYGFQRVAEIGASISAGNGGDGLIGNGGKGGTIGGPAKLVDIINPITGLTEKSLQGSLNFTYSGDIRVSAGSGGDGFARGGAGGDVSGVVVRYRTGDLNGLGVTLAAGSGGRGVSGAGGDGGSVFANSLDSESSFVGSELPAATAYTVTLTGGNGGNGARGGNGGSINGNGTVIHDATTSILSLTAGNGGDGTKGAGSGGSIRNFSPFLADPVGGLLFYRAGDGGDSVSGAGGAGGSITSSSPRNNAFIQGFLSLVAGNGGDGRSGGNGGSITKFYLSDSSQSLTTSDLAVVAGDGGNGTSGNGGSGGSIRDFEVSSRGLGLYSPFNRLLGGNGGDSAGAKGGDGGVVANVITSTNGNAYAIAAGAAGNGLTAGGRGGSVLNVKLDVAGLAKALVIAGAGGDATAFVKNDVDDSPNQTQKAFGGRVGQGGAGGDIIGFTQTGEVGAHIDFIAGNGGSTLNYGTPVDKRSYVGRGGSVVDLNITGDIGNITKDNKLTAGVDENVPIKSYNNIFVGETVEDFVRDKIRNAGIFDTLTDADGNVGIIVGAAGRGKEVIYDPVNKPDDLNSLPLPFSQNGELRDIEARNLLAAVAGSVDRIASIQVAKSIRIPNGLVGADKGGNGANDGEVGVFDYLDENGNPIPFPLREGMLVDGAVITKKLLDGLGNPITLGDRVFFL